ncbi:MAG TPA: cytochrome c [Longimicrobiales bacterium]
MTACRCVRPAAALLVLLLAACGDPETTDTRGYTKAPLEKPTLLIGGEEPGEMSRYGAPNRVVAEELRLAEETAAPDGEQPGDTAVVELPEGVTREMVAAGQEIFGGPGVCFACHGASGVGGPLAPPLNDATWLNIDGSYDAIAAIVTNGVPQPKEFAAPMPARGGAPLTDEQVRQVSAYVYSISRQ